MKRIWIMGLLIACLATGTVGCNRASETLSQLKQDFKQDVAWNVAEDDSNQQANQLEVPDPNDISIEETYEPVQTIGEAVQEITVSLYFADADRQKLVKTEKQIPKVEGMARATVETLLEGPEPDSGLVAAVPSGTQLLDINVKPDEKRCIVDFSQELRNQLASSGNSEELAIYSIANTLCQFTTIEEVEFRIEGQTVTTLAGGTDLSKAVAANAALVQ